MKLKIKRLASTKTSREIIQTNIQSTDRNIAALTVTQEHVNGTIFPLLAVESGGDIQVSACVKIKIKLKFISWFLWRRCWFYSATTINGPLVPGRTCCIAVSPVSAYTCTVLFISRIQIYLSNSASIVQVFWCCWAYRPSLRRRYGPSTSKCHLAPSQ